MFRSFIKVGLVALTLVATSAAAPAAPSLWQCGNILVELRRGMQSNSGENTVILTGAGVSFSGKTDFGFYFDFRVRGKMRRVQIGEGETGWTGGNAYLNGKRCKDYIHKEDD
jgi:hypothetical protein